MKMKPMLALTLSGIAVIMLILTFFFPWYNVQATSESSNDYVEEYYEEYEYKSKSNYDGYYTHSITKTEFTYYGTTEKDTMEEDHDKELKITSVYSNTRIFVIIAMIVIGAGIGMIYMVMKGKFNPKIAVIVLAIGFAFALIAPVYMMTSLPTAIGEDKVVPGDVFYGDTMEKMSNNFFGSENENVEGMKMETNWGGTTSWFIAIIAAVVTAGSMVVVYLYTPEDEPELVKEHMESYEEIMEPEEPPIPSEDEEKMIVN